MSWVVLLSLAAGFGFALAVALSRRSELDRMRRAVAERHQVQRSGADEAKLQHPVIDLSRCLGCATCVAVCPEEGVLELVHGQAMVVNGARCVGVAACERECPVGAVTVTIANLETRDDIPALTPTHEAIGSPGLFLAGEVTAHALIKTAIEHGTAVAAEVARRTPPAREADDESLDLCIVGAGPAGLACALEARRNGLRFAVLDQEEQIGGTVAKYPRRKLVLTQPVDLPLHGRLKQTTWTKEDLIELWTAITAGQQLPIHHGEVFQGLERDDAGYVVHTQRTRVRARHVCLAIGRRGTPRRLGVPGEDLPKVAYSLIDAHSYRDRRLLVVGGGDSAVETALALSEQPGNEVTLSYRKEAFFRVRARNAERLDAAVAAGKLAVRTRSEVVSIREGAVELSVQDDAQAGSASVATLAAPTVTLPNDEVFVMVGGVLPLDLLRDSGVSFDAEHRPAAAPPLEQGTGLTRALSLAFLLTLAALAWAVAHLDYYGLETGARAVNEKHHWLRSARGIGLGFGIASVGLIVVNLLYLARRSLRRGFRFGSLRVWMTSHVATGVLAFLCATLHAAMGPRDTPGGHAWWAMVVLLVTGAIGRYFYAWVPRAANGRELELAEAKERLARLESEWSHDHRRFAKHAHDEIVALVERRQWKGSFLGRVLSLLGVQRDLRRTLAKLAAEGRAQGVEPGALRETLALARHAHRTALMAAHYEDLRAVLASWRWLHRWVALLMVLLVAVHVFTAMAYSAFFFEGGAR